jgi:hypothetical protein
MHQFSICLDDEPFEGLRDESKVERRHYREQAAVVVTEWVRARKAAALETEQRETVAA